MKAIAIAVLALLGTTTVAHAGPFSDELSKCLVRSSTKADKTLLIKWIFAAMASHPDVKELSSITPAKADQLNKDAAGLFTTLLTDRCKSETEQAMKYEGPEVFKTSFEVLGQVAMQGMMTHADVTAYLTGLGKYVDSEALKKVLVGNPAPK